MEANLCCKGGSSQALTAADDFWVCVCRADAISCSWLQKACTLGSNLDHGQVPTYEKVLLYDCKTAETFKA